MNKKIKQKKKMNMQLKSIFKISLDKNDVLVASLDKPTAKYIVDGMCHKLKSIFPNNEILIVDKSCNFKIIKDKQEEF